MHLRVCSAFRLRATQRSNQPKLSNQRPSPLYRGDFLQLITAGRRNLGQGFALIISLLVFNSGETWHEKQTFPLTPMGLVTNQIPTINSEQKTSLKGTECEMCHRAGTQSLPLSRFNKPTLSKRAEYE